MHSALCIRFRFYSATTRCAAMYVVQALVDCNVQFTIYAIYALQCGGSSRELLKGPISELHCSAFLTAECNVQCLYCFVCNICSAAYAIMFVLQCNVQYVQCGGSGLLLKGTDK